MSWRREQETCICLRPHKRFGVRRKDINQCPISTLWVSCDNQV